MRQPLRQSSTPVLRNPIILGGVAAMGIVLIVVVVIVLTTSAGSRGSSGSATTPVTKTPTQEQVEGQSGVTGKAASTINVRSGPGNGYNVLGVLRKGAEVSVVGKDEEGGWLQIQYPAHSKLRGWVIADSLELEGDLASVAVATPDSIPMPDVPTYEPVATVPAAPSAEPTVTPTFTPAPTLPNLAVSGSLVSGGVLVVTVTNQGAGALTGAAIDVSVFDASGTQLLNSTSSAPQNLNPGASIDIKTGYLAFAGPSQLLVIVDPNGKIPETDDTNNRLIVTLSSGPTPTATKTPHP